MYSIYKYKLRSNTTISADIIKWLNIGTDPNGEMCVWAMVRTDSNKKKHFRFNEIGTGWEFDDNEYIGEYIGTVNDGPYVWHYFAQEIVPVKEENISKEDFDRLKEMMKTLVLSKQEHCFA